MKYLRDTIVVNTGPDSGADYCLLFKHTLIWRSLYGKQHPVCMYNALGLITFFYCISNIHIYKTASVTTIYMEF